MSDTVTLPRQAKDVRRGFSSLPCPCCGDMDQRKTVFLTGPEDGSLFHCSACDSDFSPVDVQAMIGRWTGVLAWVNTMPPLPE